MGTLRQALSTRSPKEQWTFPVRATYEKRSRSICVDDPSGNTLILYSARNDDALRTWDR